MSDGDREVCPGCMYPPQGAHSCRREQQLAQPTRPPNPFQSLLGPEPEWITCERCGKSTSSSPCFECHRTILMATQTGERASASERSIPRRFSWATVDAPELAGRVRSKTLAADIARVMAAKNVIFAGLSGSGKTSLAVACMRERFPAMFVSALRLGVARIQSHAGQGEAELVERAMYAPLVLIDEVGGEGKTATNAVRDVIFSRYDDDLPTWITTGFKHAELATMYGEGIARRLTEGACVVNLGGDGAR